MTSRGTVGIVGVGNMGGGMAGRLLDRGWRVQACDRVADRVETLVARGASRASRPADAARGADALIVCVVDAEQTAEVLFGAEGAAVALAPGAAVLLCPTIAPADVEALAARLAAAGLSAVDAPMSGGPARARDGSMSLMVACSDDTLARVESLLRDLSSQVFRISDLPGDGARTKLVNNLLAGINLAGAAEVLALARAMGLDLSRTLDVIERSSGQSWIGLDRMRRAVVGDYEPRAHVTLLLKDTGLALAAAREAGFSGPVGPAAHGVFDAAARAGLADRDDAALFLLLAGMHKPPPASS